METPSARLEKIHDRIEKLLSLQGESNRKFVELKSENQVLMDKIKELESEKLKNNLQNKQEINHKINELLSEVERCMALLKR